MPNDTLRVYITTAGRFQTYDDFTAAPPPNEKITFFSGEHSPLAPTWEQVDDNVNPILRRHQVLAANIPLDGDNVIVQAILVYKSYQPSTLSSGEQFDILVRAYDLDDWFLPDDGPADNDEAITIWNTLCTTAEAEGVVDVTGGEIPFAVADIKDVIQEILDRPTWASGGDVFFILKIDDVITTSSPEKVTCKEFEEYEDIPGRVYAYIDIEYYYEPLPPGYDKHIWQTLEFEQSLSGDNTNNSDVSDEIEFEQDIIGIRDHIRSVSQLVRFFETISSNLNDLEENYEDLLIFTETVDGSVARDVELEDELNLDDIIVGNSDFTKQPYDELLFEEDIDYTKAYEVSLEDDLSFSEDMLSDKHNRDLIQQLTFTQTITIEAILDTISVTQTITFEEDFDENTVLNQLVEDDLVISQAILGYMEGAVGLAGSCDRFDLIWKPFTSDPFPAKPTLNKQTISLSIEETFIDLPAPNFTDREELTLTRIQRKTRGGELKTFSDDEWPKVRTFRYKFDNLTLEKVEEFHEFLNLSLGKRVSLTDHESRVWFGYIVNPQGEAANFARTCGSTTEFDFDGTEEE